VLVRTLELIGYLKNNRISKKYHFGLKLISLSNTASRISTCVKQARPFLQDLMLKTGLTVHNGNSRRCRGGYH